MKIEFLIFIFCISATTWSQNLVPNGDFEQYSVCPYYFSQLNCSSWISPSSSGSPDYYNHCATPASKVSVPSNGCGFQYARSGVAYTGIYLSQHSNGCNYSVREYIEAALTSPLVANSCYYFEMYVSLADSMKYSSDDIGVYFSESQISGVANYYTLPFIPQINNAQGNYIDSANWTKVSGIYTATGSEKYILIGSFHCDSLINLISVNNSGYPYSYCYLDDVSLTPVSCNAGVNEQNTFLDVKIYPNPMQSSSTLFFAHNSVVEQFGLKIFDITGTLIRNIPEISRFPFTIERENLSSGIYFIELKSKSKTERMKLIIN